VHELSISLQAHGYQTDIATETFQDFSKSVEFSNGTRVVRIGTKGNRIIASLRFLFFYLANLKSYELVIARTFSVHSMMLAVAGFFYRKAPVLILMMDAETELVGFRKPLVRRVITALFSGFNLISAPSSQLYSELVEFGFAQKKIQLIPNGIKAEQTSKTVELTKPVQRFLYMGNIATSKGVFDLLEAYRALKKQQPEVSLTFIGSGAELGFLKQKIDDDQIGDVLFLDFVPFDKVPETIAEFDCLVLPSYSEGFGLIAFEAALRPIELICSDVADLKLYLGDRATFYPPGNLQQLTEAMIEKSLLKGKRTYLNSSWIENLSFSSLVNRLLVEYRKAKTLDG